MIEDQHIEWKESWRDEYLKWICAFANSEGGMLEIGRNDEGKRRTATQETAQETTQERVLASLCVEPEITRKDLAKHIGITVDGVKYYHLDKLRKAGRIRHSGPTKKRRWEVLEDEQE